MELWVVPGKVSVFLVPRGIQAWWRMVAGLIRAQKASREVSMEIATSESQMDERRGFRRSERLVTDAPS